MIIIHLQTYTVLLLVYGVCINNTLNYCYIAAKGRNNITCLWKYKSSLLPWKGWNGCMWERDRKMDFYHWHHIGTDIFQSQSGTAWVYNISSILTLRYIFQNLPFSWFSSRGPTTPGWCPRWCILSTQLTASLLMTNHLSYIIFWMPTNFSYQFSIHMTHFHCLLFTLRHSLWNPQLLGLLKVNM